MLHRVWILSQVLIMGLFLGCLHQGATASSVLLPRFRGGSEREIKVAMETVEPAKADPVKPEQARSLIEKARQAWLTGNADAFADLFTPDGELIVPGNRWVGPAAIRKIAAEFAASNTVVKIEVRRLIIAGNQAAIEWYWEDTHKTSGNRMRADDVIMVEFQGDRIRRWREYIDTATYTQK